MNLNRLLPAAALAALFALTGCNGGEAGPQAPANTASNAPAAEAGGDKLTGMVPIVMETSMGTIELELDADKAPISTANFVSYVKDGFYDGTIFHRVIPTFMIQGGGFTPDGQEKPTKDPIKNEADNGVKNERGTIAMARTNDPDSATAQFFINVVDNAMLDYPNAGGAGYAVFGKVTKGMDVVDKIKDVATTSKGGMDDWPVDDVTIKSVKLGDTTPRAGDTGSDDAPAANAPAANGPAGPAGAAGGGH